MIRSPDSAYIPMCTLFWPNNLAPRCSISDKHENQTLWVLGWNPRGFAVVAADIVAAESVAQASSLVSKIREQHKKLGSRCVKDLVGLRVIGRLRGKNNNGTDSSVDRAAPPPPLPPTASPPPGSNPLLTEAESALKFMRQTADIWLELSTSASLLTKKKTFSSSPIQDVSLVELYCCGYKYLPQLHIVHFDGDLPAYSPSCSHAQSIFNLLPLRSLKLMKEEGIKPKVVRGAVSELEGPVVPAHCFNLFRRVVKSGSRVASPVDSQPGLTPKLQHQNSPGGLKATSGVNSGAPGGLSSDGETLMLPESHHSGQNSGEGDPSSLGNNDSNVGQTGSNSNVVTPPKQTTPVHASAAAAGVSGGKLHSHSDDSSSDTEDEVTILPGAPPRLQYPPFAGETELSIVLRKVNTGYRVRKTLRSLKSWTGDEVVWGPIPKNVTPQKQAPVDPQHGGKFGAVLLFFLSLFLPLLNFPARHSYTLRVLDYKLRAIINLVAVATNHSNSCGLHPIIPHQVSSPSTKINKYSTSANGRNTCFLEFAARMVWDAVLGNLLSITLVLFRDTIAWSIRAVGHHMLFDLHFGYLDWFLGWPAGMKMNDDLNNFLHLFARGILEHWHRVFVENPAVDWDWLELGYTILIILAPFGLTFALSFVSDACNIATIHLRLLFHILSIVYHGFRTVLNSVLLQFRGKKENPLRHRVDEGEFAADKMILGTLLCTLTVFLFPTVALYYFYLAVVRTSIWLVQELLNALGYVTFSIPVYGLLRWILCRKRIPYGIEFSNVTTTTCIAAAANGDDDTVGGRNNNNNGTQQQQPALVVDCQMKTVPMPIAEVFAEFNVVLWIIFSPFTPSNIFGFIVHAENKPCVNERERLFGHVVKNPKSPPVTIM